MMYRLTTLFLLLFFAFHAHATYLSGRVTDMNGEALPFANVFIEGTNRGSTTNEDGYYQLELENGSYRVGFLYIGYQKQVQTVVMSGKPITLNVKLEAEDIKIQEVVVTGSEDPAYPIMRKVIALRDEHYNEVKSFRSQAYVKGLQRIVSAPDKIFGQTVNFDGTLDSNNAGIIYLSESVTDLTFEKPDKVKEVMISSKVSGNSQGFSWNRAGDMVAFDLYTNKQEIDFLSDRVFVSPLADNAFFFYKFRLEGYFVEDGRIINKIAVIPKRSADPVYRGYIYVVENEWVLQSIDLYLPKEAGINFLDTLNLSYRYMPIKDSIWMPVSQRFSFNFNLLGIKAEGYLVSIYSDYELNPEIPKGTFNNEVLSVSEESNERALEYWKKIRPVPLTEEEDSDYTRKDSLEEVRSTKEYQDSLSRASNRFKPLDILLGYNYRNFYHKLSIQLTPLFEMVQYNTIEGWNIRLGADLNKEFDGGRLLQFSPMFRYGTSNGHFNAHAKLRFHYNRKRFGYFEVSGGKYVFQYNRDEPISDLVNTLNTLLLEQNFYKAFEETYGEIGHRIELFNGFFLWTSVRYGRRFPLSNTSYTSVDIKGRELTSNVPENADITPPDLQTHDALVFNAKIKYRPGQKYMSRPDRKIILETKWPTFSVEYTKSVPGVFKSSLNYDLLEGSIGQAIKLGLFGTIQYKVMGGIFLNSNRIDFQDYAHFYYNLTYIGQHHMEGFQLLDYYKSATNEWYAQGHAEHHFNGFFFNKIPGVRKLRWQLVAGAHVLYSPEFGTHAEYSVGIERIFRVIRVDFVNSYGNDGTRFGGVIAIVLNGFSP